MIPTFFPRTAKLCNSFHSVISPPLRASNNIGASFYRITTINPYFTMTRRSHHHLTVTSISHYHTKPTSHATSMPQNQTNVYNTTSVSLYHTRSCTLSSRHQCHIDLPLPEPCATHSTISHYYTSLLPSHSCFTATFLSHSYT